MSYEVIDAGGKPVSYSKKTFLMTSKDDLSKLPRAGVAGAIENGRDTEENDPCAYGSVALLCTGDVTEAYILTPDNEWVKM